jgi:SAM-dependent methyltransferase
MPTARQNPHASALFELELQLTSSVSRDTSPRLTVSRQVLRRIRLACPKYLAMIVGNGAKEKRTRETRILRKGPKRWAMDGSAFGNLRLYPSDGGFLSASMERAIAPVPDLPDPALCHELANRELIRPPGYRRGHHTIQPYSPAWFDELEQKRYSRHGSWLPSALEFGRHPGESIAIIGPGLGSDAIRYLQQGTSVTLAIGPDDHPKLIQANLARHGLTPKTIPLTDNGIPVADGAFDVVIWNDLHRSSTSSDRVSRLDELYRVLKPGGKVIGLFPARYDAGFWQDVLLPLQYLYWKRPADSTNAPKASARELRRAFSRFTDYRSAKRHLRRSELPHLWRTVPLLFLERMIGRILIFKAFKPLSAARAVISPLSDSQAA